MRKVILSLAGVLAITAIAPEAFAIPSFSRQASMTCKACHSQHVPILNGFGQAFKASGYPMMGTQGKVEGEGLSIPDTLNASMALKARYQKTYGANTDVIPGDSTNSGQWQVPDEFNLFFGGRIAETVGFYFEAHVSTPQLDATFKLPAPLILPQVQTIPGIDGQKMSKSYGNTIPLFASEKELRPLVMSIKTDSKGVEEPKNPEECNVFALHKLFSIEQLPELKRRYVEGGIGYKESKEILAENMNKYLAPFRERREQIATTTDDVITVLRNGADIARNQAKLKMERVRKAIGVDL